MALRSRWLVRLAAPLFAVALAVVPGIAQALEPAELIKAVETKYKDVKTLKADFTQTTRNELFGDETVKGRVVVKRPAKMHWSFGKDREFVTDGKKLWIYTAQDKQVLEYDDISQNRSSAESLLTDMDKLEEKFVVKVLQSDDKLHVLELSPKAGDDKFKKVRITLGADLVVQEVRITDAFDNVTELSFANVSLNQPADDAMFTFRAPNGVDVIKASN